MYAADSRAGEFELPRSFGGQEAGRVFQMSDTGFGATMLDFHFS